MPHRCPAQPSSPIPSSPLSQTRRGWAPSPPTRDSAPLRPRRAHAKRTPGAGGLRVPRAALGDDGALDKLQQPLLPQDPGHGEGGAQRLPQPGEAPDPHQVQAQGPDAALEAEGLIDGEILLETLVQLQREGRLPAPVRQRLAQPSRRRRARGPSGGCSCPRRAGPGSARAPQPSPRSPRSEASRPRRGCRASTATAWLRPPRPPGGQGAGSGCRQRVQAAGPTCLPAGACPGAEPASPSPCSAAPPTGPAGPAAPRTPRSGGRRPPRRRLQRHRRAR